ncbi:5-formyltetrahydrofolate cyclo-ligase [Kutzneria kofuensis]|uniref:5-formyltetrahydrofolate cyclo-ligase n=1 Tax=Kutzneria kofuensis TaxID=103725 RepID=A0A7W9KG38_9PSEU|nr:5-formyltetrahydrofolate cyclo-ligase [Kutzneria kofuensis]MBB5891958.1 5-formyltetrahydrofolate cyclo-ligase [Kutzneria kofuensis]
MTPTGRDPEKDSWRKRLVKARAELSSEVREAEAQALAEAVPAVGWPASTVCAYVPVGTEPGSLALLDALRAAGRRVLLPIVTGKEPLDWGVYFGPDSLVPGPFGLREPAGLRLGRGAVANADAVLIPALAVDRRGVRLGRGAGHYDRSLVGVTAPRIAVVRAEEFVDRLPAEPHDVLMTAVLTPSGGFVRL